MNPDYNSITETPGVGASRFQLSVLYTRYKYAAEFCRDKDVLEVACGAGQGLGYLSHVAKKVVGGDIDETNLQTARRYYQGREKIKLLSVDGHQLPFDNMSFDVIILYEAIYYLDQPERFLKEAKRVLRKGGTLIISSVNHEWSDFNPSPFSKRYFSAFELKNILTHHDFQTEVFVAFPVEKDSLRGQLVSLVKRTAVKFHLIPKTMNGKQWLKRLFFGKLTPIPNEIVEGMTEYFPPQPISSDQVASNYRFIYAVGRS